MVCKHQGLCLCLTSVPTGTTRQPRDGEISGVDYNFVSIEDFFSLEESGALLESGKFKGLKNKHAALDKILHTKTSNKLSRLCNRKPSVLFVLIFTPECKYVNNATFESRL